MTLTNLFINFLTNLISKIQSQLNLKLVDLGIYYTWKNIKSYIKSTTTNLKYLLPLGMINLICLMVLIQFLTFRIILNLSSKSTKL